MICNVTKYSLNNFFLSFIYFLVWPDIWWWLKKLCERIYILLIWWTIKFFKDWDNWTLLYIWIWVFKLHIWGASKLLLLCKLYSSTTWIRARKDKSQNHYYSPGKLEIWFISEVIGLEVLLDMSQNYPNP